MATKKGKIKVKSYYRVGDTPMDKIANAVAGFKSKKVKSHTRKYPKKR